MAKKGSSRRWMHEHLSDEFVKKAQKEGYRSRAVYKLLEIIEKNKTIQNGDKVLDLGAAPGGWSQVAAKFVGNNGKVIAQGTPSNLINNIDAKNAYFGESFNVN